MPQKSDFSLNRRNDFSSPHTQTHEHEEEGSPGLQLHSAFVWFSFLENAFSILSYELRCEAMRCEPQKATFSDAENGLSLFLLRVSRCMATNEQNGWKGAV